MPSPTTRISAAELISYFTCCGSVASHIALILVAPVELLILPPLPSTSNVPAAEPLPHHLALSGEELSQTGPSWNLNSSEALIFEMMINLFLPAMPPYVGADGSHCAGV